MNHIMLDLETLGTTPGCIVASIGACVFDPSGVGAAFYTAVDICASPGLVADPGTVRWWMGQSEEARMVFKDPERKPLDLALAAFAEWVRDVNGTFVWCHGASFDAPLLEAAYKVRNMRPPWEFYDVRDTRTLYHVSGVYPVRGASTHHNALSDAQAQAEAAIKALNAIGWPAENLK